MTTMPVTVQERVPMPFTGAGAGHQPAGGLNVNDIIRILKQRVFLILFIWFALTGITVGVTFYLDRSFPLYQAQSAIQVESPNPKTPMQISEPLIQVELMDRYVADQMVRVKSDTVLQATLTSAEVMGTSWYQEGKTKGDVGELLDELKDDLKVAQVPNTNFVLISFATRQAADAPVIINTLIAKYLADVEAVSMSAVRREYAQAQQQLQNLLTNLRNRRKDKENFVAQAFQTPGVTEGLNVVGETFRTLAEEVTRLEAEKLRFKAAYENLKGLNPDQVKLSPQMLQLIQQDPQVYQYTSQLLQLQQAREIQLRRVGPKHRDIQLLDSQIQSTQESLDKIQLEKEREIREYQLSSAESAYLNATQAELQLRDRLIAQEAMQQDIDRKLIQYRSMEEEVTMLEDQYNQLWSFVNQLDMMQSEQGNIVRVRQLSQAQLPREKYFPKWELNLPAGSFLGLLLGIGLAVLLEMVDTSLKTARDISRHVHVPILGTVPDVDDEEVDIEQPELACLSSPRSMMAEAFRSIRTNLLLSAPADRQRTVLIASAKPEEGRTTVAINLAISIAQNGRRVLLVDANFHRPALQRFFPNMPKDGLSNLLIAQSNLASLVTPTQLPNLDVLGSGPIPPNPTELLAGPQLKQVIAEAMDRYDQIIFDGPPVLLVSDALVLAGMADGILLVCRAKLTSRGVAMRAREQIERVNGRIFGAVLNGAQVTRGGYYREQIRSYYEYQPEEVLAAANKQAVLPAQSESDNEGDSQDAT